MSNFVDEYRTLVHARLRSNGGRTIGPDTQDSALTEVVFFPSFHPEAILQVTKADETELRFTTLTSSLWYSSEVSGDGPSPKRVTEKVALERAQAERFWFQIANLRPHSIVNGEAVGLDGMSVDASYCTSSSSHFFSVWSPTEELPQGQFVLLLYKLAWELLTDEESIERLEQLHGYLHLGVPCRIIGESPRRVRVFGSLSSGHERELGDFFNSIPTDESLIVDMTNFDGMGTILYPVFAKFADAHERLAWVGSPNAVRHLQAIGIHEATICNSIEDAYAKIKEQ